jgi:hypothetical protein
MPVQVRFTVVHIGAKMSEQTQAVYDFRHLQDLTSCPPAEAVPKDGIFYVFHSSDPPDPTDFRTAFQRNVYADRDPCIQRSNSVFSDLSAINSLCASMRKRGRGLLCKYVSLGKIQREHGVILEGARHHHSFWVCGKSSMHAIFTELAN